MNPLSLSSHKLKPKATSPTTKHVHQQLILHLLTTLITALLLLPSNAKAADSSTKLTVMRQFSALPLSWSTYIASFLSARELLFFARSSKHTLTAARDACDMPSYNDLQPKTTLILSTHNKSNSRWPVAPAHLHMLFFQALKNADLKTGGEEFYEEFLRQTNVAELSAVHAKALARLPSSMRLASFLIDLVTWAQVWAQVGAQVWDQVWDQVGDQVGAQVREQVGAQVGAQVREQVKTQIRNELRAKLIKEDLLSKYNQGKLSHTLEPAIDYALLRYDFYWTSWRLSSNANILRENIAAELLLKFGRNGEEKCADVLSKIMLTLPAKKPSHLIISWVNFLQEALEPASSLRGDDAL